MKTRSRLPCAVKRDQVFGELGGYREVDVRRASPAQRDVKFPGRHTDRAGNGVDGLPALALNLATCRALFIGP